MPSAPAGLMVWSGSCFPARSDWRKTGSAGRWPAPPRRWRCTTRARQRLQLSRGQIVVLDDGGKGQLALPIQVRQRRERGFRQRRGRVVLSVGERSLGGDRTRLQAPGHRRRDRRRHWALTSMARSPSSPAATAGSNAATAGAGCSASGTIFVVACQMNNAAVRDARTIGPRMMRSLPRRPLRGEVTAPH